MDCPTGKVVYRSERAAAHGLAAVQANGRGDHRTEIRWYPCGECYAWHLTSSPPRGDPETSPRRPPSA